MPRGATKGERRRLRRRGTAQPHADQPPAPLSERDPVETLAERMGEQRPWVRRLWATPGNRLALSLVVVAVFGYALVRGLTDPSAFDAWRFTGFFVLAPPILALFGPQLVEAVLDLARGRNSWPPIFHRLGARLDRHAGVIITAFVVYLLAGAWVAPALLGR